MDTLKKGFKSLLTKRSEIYGVLALWVMWFHIANRVSVPGAPGIITPLINMGNVAVDVFLLISGYCVHESWKKDHSIKSFYLKRFLRILIPYLIFATPLYLWKNVIEGGNFNLNAIIGDISTLNFWRYGMQTTWYVCAILLYYILVPILSVFVRKNRIIGIGVILCSYLLNQILWWVLPSYSVTSIAWTRLPVFILGIFISCHGEVIRINTKKWKTALIFIAVLLTIVFPYREWYKSFFGNRPEYLWAGYVFIAPGVLLIIYEVVLRLPDIINKWLRVFGKVSLEIYIIHVFVLRILDYFKLQKVLFAWYYVVVTLITLGIALLYYYMKNLITARKLKNSNKDLLEGMK